MLLNVADSDAVVQDVHLGIGFHYCTLIRFGTSEDSSDNVDQDKAFLGYSYGARMQQMRHSLEKSYSSISPLYSLFEEYKASAVAGNMNPATRDL